MAQEVNTIDSYDQYAHPDITDMVYDLQPTDYPFMTHIGVDKNGTNTEKDWSMRPTTKGKVNARVEGDQFEADPRVPPVKRSNRMQILDKRYQVSDTSRAENTVGFEDIFIEEQTRAIEELKADIEFALLSRQVAVVGSSATARRLAGLPAWLTSNLDRGAGGTAPGLAAGGYPNAVGTAGTARALSMSDIIEVIISIYNNSGKRPNLLIANPTLIVGIADAFFDRTYTGIGSIQQDLGAKPRSGAVVMGKVDIWHTALNSRLMIMPDRNAPSGNRASEVSIVNSDYAEVCYLRPIKTETLAKDGDNVKGRSITELTLKVDNEAAHGGVADINDTLAVAA